MLTHEPYVLIVEDDQYLRRLVGQWVEAFGYCARVAEGADEALAQMERQKPLAVIVDVVLPGKSGLWLVEQVNSRWPALPVVVTSGAASTDGYLRKAQEQGAVFLTKPFTVETLRQAVQSAVAPRD
jgi:DNA-binding NtrC family response regulator